VQLDCGTNNPTPVTSTNSSKKPNINNFWCPLSQNVTKYGIGWHTLIIEGFLSPMWVQKIALWSQFYWFKECSCDTFLCIFCQYLLKWKDWTFCGKRYTVIDFPGSENDRITRWCSGLGPGCHGKTSAFTWFSVLARQAKQQALVRQKRDCLCQKLLIWATFVRVIWKSNGVRFFESQHSYG